MSSAKTSWLDAHEVQAREQAVTTASLDEMSSVGHADVRGLTDALRKAVRDFALAADHPVSCESVSIAVGAFGSEMKRIYVAIVQAA